MDNENIEEFQIPKDVVERLGDPEILRRYVEEGKTFQEILEFDDSVMERFYRAACALFHAHRYRDACDAFLFLTTLNPFVSAYWLGLGMCEQLNEEYKPALVAYSMAVISDRQNPVPHYHAAACHNALNEVDDALSSLEKAIEVCGENEELKSIKDSSMSARDSLLDKKRRR